MSELCRLRRSEGYGACDDEVPLCCPPSGQAAGNGSAVPGGYETLCCLRSAISPRLQPGEILQDLCGKGTPETEECQ